MYFRNLDSRAERVRLMGCAWAHRAGDRRLRIDWSKVLFENRLIAPLARRSGHLDNHISAIWLGSRLLRREIMVLDQFRNSCVRFARVVRAFRPAYTARRKIASAAEVDDLSG